jgi:hypothetical protein
MPFPKSTKKSGPSRFVIVAFTCPPKIRGSPTFNPSVLVIITKKKSRAQGQAALAHFTWSRPDRSKNYGGYYGVLISVALILLDVLAQRDQHVADQL